MLFQLFHFLVLIPNLQLSLSLSLLGGFVILDSAGRTRIDVAFLTAASSQAGYNKPDQVFVGCDIVGRFNEHNSPDNPFTGILLEMSTEGFVEPSSTRYFPHVRSQFGRLRMYCADKFAVHLLDLPDSFGDCATAVRVGIQLLTFEEDHLPKRLRVTGVEIWDSEKEEATGIVEADTHTDRVLGNAADQPVHGRADSVVGVGDCEVDFLDLLSSDNGHNDNAVNACDSTGNENETGTAKRSFGQTSRKSKKQRTQRTIDSGDEGEDLEQFDQGVNRDDVDHLLGDPGVSAFLDAEDVSELKNVVTLCQESSKSSELAAWRRSVITTCSDTESDADEVVDDSLSLFQDGDQPAAQPSASSSSFQREVRASMKFQD